MKESPVSEIPIRLWNGEKGTVWVDTDGDIGILDNLGYSIIIHQHEAEVFKNWLNANFPVLLLDEDQP